MSPATNIMSLEHRGACLSPESTGSHVYHQETQAGVCWTRYEKKKVLYLAEYYVSQNPRQKRFRKTTHDLADPGDPSLGKLT